MRRLLLSCLMLLAAGCITSVSGPYVTPIAIAPVNPPALPRTGDRLIYLVRNGYNGEPVGQLDYRMDSAERDHYVAAVTASPGFAAPSRTELYRSDGNWVHHALTNHNQLVEYEFNPPYPAYVFPLEARRTWSQRVNARNPATGRVASVRVDGEVLGAERIVTSAGEFDAVKIVRRIYAGDFDGFLTETQITETEWYAPELGRAVRLDRNSEWYDSSRSPGGATAWFNRGLRLYGDWHVFELTSWPGMGARPAIKPPPPPPR
ncbi:MAG TPA: hypothetical protein VGO84_13560 [Burkholderiales bacterium]|nr:hypothetical protein [Burkholderiales bacterium]